MADIDRRFFIIWLSDLFGFKPLWNWILKMTNKKSGKIVKFFKCPHGFESIDKYTKEVIIKKSRQLSYPVLSYNSFRYQMEQFCKEPLGVPFDATKNKKDKKQ